MKFRDLLQDLLEEQLPCQKVVTYDMLKQAKYWWINRLSDPNIIMKILRTKFTVDELKTWTDKEIDRTVNYTVQDLQAARKKIDLINKLAYYNDPKGSAIMYVKSNEPTIININCSYVPKYSNDQLVSSLVHEIQHHIHYLIGGDEYLNDIRGGIKIEKNPYRPQAPVSEKSWFDKAKEYINSLTGSKDVDKSSLVNDTYFLKRYQSRVWEHFKSNQTYACNPTEIQSRVAQVRMLLNLKPGQDITIEMLKNKKVYEEFELNLMCWGGRKDNVSLQDYLNNLNSLVKNDAPNTSTQV
jgi:hypothetical protein